jgi:hypothetical protein
MLQKVPQSKLRPRIHQKVPTRLSSLILPQRQHPHLHPLPNRLSHLRLRRLFQLPQRLHLPQHYQILQPVLQRHPHLLL